jgi:hypothetical protein
MTNKIMVHDYATGESYEREMTTEEQAQADLDMQTFQIQEPVVGES